MLENAGKLAFPFRRYQIQKVWRGERPQEGRYREFTQADIDVVDRDTLPFHYEVEIPLVIGDALSGLPIPPIRIQVNNRKLCQGFYRGLGIEDTDAALRAVDRVDRLGPAGRRRPADPDRRRHARIRRRPASRWPRSRPRMRPLWTPCVRSAWMTRSSTRDSRNWSGWSRRRGSTARDCSSPI